jgi:hypothetical protein
VSSLSDRIGELKRRAAEVASALTSLSDRRRSYAFAAVSDSDAKARKAIADIDFESDSLRKEQATISDALEIGEALAKQEALDAQAEARRERERAAYTAARGVVTLNEEIDLALSQLREMFERRSVILRSLGNVGVVDPSLLMRLANKAGPTSAAHSAGLGRYLNLEMTPVVSQRPLSDANSVLLGIGEPSKPNGKANGRGSNGRQ